jgi:hypothetical protein
VKLTVEIRPYDLEVESKVAFYSFLIKGSDDPQLEIEKFYARFVEEPYAAAAEDIKGLIQGMAQEYGANERFFRKEGDSHAMPSHVYNRPLLRLYCLRCCDKVVILGNGGIKTSGKTQGSPDCYPHFLVMNAIAVAFLRMGISCCDLPKRKSPFTVQIDVPKLAHELFFKSALPKEKE